MYTSSQTRSGCALSSKQPMSLPPASTARNQNAGNPTLGANQAATHPLKPNVEEKLPFPVTCGFHPWMKGWVLPRNNGYFAVTDANGKFEIKDLPTGDQLTFVVWHEFTSGRDGGGYLKKFTVNNDQIKPASEGFTVTLEKDKPLVDLEFEVPVGAFAPGG